MKKYQTGLLIAFCLVFTLVGFRVSRRGTFAISLPTNNLLFDSNRSANYEIYSLSTSGHAAQLTNNSSYDSWWPKPSPDGKKLIFYRTPKGTHDTDYTKTSLWAANIDGGNLHQLIGNKGYGWIYQGHAEWSPNGKNLVMIGGLGQLYITDTEGKNPKQINIVGQVGGLSDPSYSPDGSKIVYAYNRHIWTVGVGGGSPTPITADSLQDYDPYFSPNGQQIAMLTHAGTNKLANWSIRLIDANKSNLHFLINDGNINSKPAWSLDGSTLYFHRHPNGAGSGFYGLWSINAEGSSLKAIDAGSGSNEYPAVLYVAGATTTQSQTTTSTPGSTSSTASTKTPTSAQKVAQANTIQAQLDNEPTAITAKQKKKNGLFGLSVFIDAMVIAWFILRWRKKHPKNY